MGKYCIFGNLCNRRVCEFVSVILWIYICISVSNVCNSVDICICACVCTNISAGTCTVFKLKSSEFSSFAESLAMMCDCDSSLIA